MAFNNYNNYLPNNQYYPQQYPMGNGYQSYQQPQNVVRPVQQNVQQQYETPIQDVRFVTGEEAKAYIVVPNGNALLIDRANNIAHFKSADAMGQSRSKVYKFEEIDEQKINETKQSISQIDTSAFVKKEDISGLLTKDDLKNFITRDDLKSIEAKLEQVQKQVRINEILNGEKVNNG
ncbi:MAG: hypothetical protein ACI4PF_02320 [Christensenellales bacterium]